MNRNSPFVIRFLIKTKTAVNQRKTAYSGCFGTPGETRTHYIPLRRRTLYPGEVRGLIQQIFNFQAPQDSNELPLRRRPLYPTELRGHNSVILAQRAAGVNDRRQKRVARLRAAGNHGMINGLRTKEVAPCVSSARKKPSSGRPFCSCSR